MSKSTNAILLSVTRPKFDFDDGKWMGLPNDLYRGKWPVPLSALAHTILCALLSLPPDAPWENVRQWVDDLPFEDSSGARAKALTELEGKGYLKRVRHSMGRGKFGHGWSVTAEPDVSAGRITSPFTRHESTHHDNGPILEDGPSKDGPSTSTSTGESGTDEWGKGRARLRGGPPKYRTRDIVDVHLPPVPDATASASAMANPRGPSPSTPLHKLGELDGYEYEVSRDEDGVMYVVRTNGVVHEVCTSPLASDIQPAAPAVWLDVRECIGYMTWIPLAPMPSNVRPFRRKPA
jgi:hypothetical protein